jgi:hypothetical protein
LREFGQEEKGHPRGDLRFQARSEAWLQNRPEFAVQARLQDRLELSLESWLQTTPDFGFQKSAHDRAEREREGRSQEPAQITVQPSFQNPRQMKVEAGPELAPRLRRPDVSPIRSGVGQARHTSELLTKLVGKLAGKLLRKLAGKLL